MIKSYFYKLRICAGVYGVSLSLLLVSGWWFEALNRDVGDLNQHLSVLKKRVAQREMIAQLIKDNKTEFDRFKACQFGEPHTPETFKKLCPYPIEFGSSSRESRDAKGDCVIFQEVSFLIRCLKDTDVYVFIDQLLDKGPGIFQIHDVTISRIGSLSEGMLETIASGKPDYLFESKITATWIHR